MRSVGLLVLSLMSLGCAKNECVDADGCDTGEESFEPTGPVSVSVKWVESTTLEVTVSGMIKGTFGIVEAGLGNTGWYGEDCPDGPYCHEIVEGDNYFTSVRSRGQDWDGTLDNDETWLHRDGMQNQVWAVLSYEGRCQKAGGENEELFTYCVDNQACPTN